MREHYQNAHTMEDISEAIDKHNNSLPPSSDTS